MLAAGPTWFLNSDFDSQAGQGKLQQCDCDSTNFLGQLHPSRPKATSTLFAYTL